MTTPNVLPKGNKTFLYAGLIGGALLLYMSYRSRSAANSAQTATVDSSSGYPLLTSDPLGSSANGTSTAAIDYSAAETNQTWETKAEQALVGQGHSPLDVQRALEKYFAGVTLTAAEGDLVNKAVATFGLPPQGIVNVPDVTPKPPPPSTPTPTPTPKPVPKPVPHPTPKPTSHPAPSPFKATYTIERGDTLTSIARRFYGSGSSFYINKIAHANGITNDNLIYAGHTLRIPR